MRNRMARRSAAGGMRAAGVPVGERERQSGLRAERARRGLRADWRVAATVAETFFPHPSPVRVTIPSIRYY